jgi:hypothetical protein
VKRNCKAPQGKPHEDGGFVSKVQRSAKSLNKIRTPHCSLTYGIQYLTQIQWMVASESLCFTVLRGSPFILKDYVYMHTRLSAK